MGSQGSITRWIHQVKSSDHDSAGAAQEIWQRYHHRLVGLARSKLKGSAKRVSDEEDVVVEAFDSFFRQAERGRFPRLEDRDDLWQILVMLTARKCANLLRHDRRQKRGGGKVRGESVFMLSDDENRGIDQVVGEAPTSEFASHVTRECRELLQKLNDDTLERIAISKLEGFTNAEIGAMLDIRTRTVERKLQMIRALWDSES